MPMFDYRCRNCGNKFEELVFTVSTPDSEITCPDCAKKGSERLLSAPSISVSSTTPSCYTGNCSPTSGFS